MIKELMAFIKYLMKFLLGDFISAVRLVLKPRAWIYTSLVMYSYARFAGKGYDYILLLVLIAAILWQVYSSGNWRHELKEMKKKEWLEKATQANTKQKKN